MQVQQTMFALYTSEHCHLYNVEGTNFMSLITVKLRGFMVCAALLFSVTGTLWTDTPAHASEQKLLLHNGVVFTADVQHPYAEAVGVEGDTIVIVGSEGEVAKRMGNDARRMDMKGNFLMPGLLDSHVHVGFAGFQHTTVSFPENLNSAKNIRAFAKEQLQKPHAWIDDVLLFMNVPLSYWEHPEMLSAALDSGEFADIPVILAGSDAHTGWCNTVMLRRAGLNAQQVEALPPAVRSGFGRDKDGNLNGFTSEGAWDEVLKHAPPVSEESMEDALLAGAKILHGYGFTAWMDPIANIRPLAPIFNAAPNKNDNGLLPVYMRLLKSGALQARVSTLLLVKLDSDASIIEDVAQVTRRYAGLPNLKILGVKLLQDGVLEYPSRTAKLSREYVGMPGYDGPRNIDPERYGKLVAAVDALGLVAHTHAIGDRAVREALDAVGYARKQNGNSGVLHSITHLEVVAPEDLPRFKELGVGASMQLLWGGRAPSTTVLLEGSVPPELLNALYPAQSLIRNGALLAGASDWPVSTPNPFRAMHTAVTRMGPEGFLPPQGELLARKEALLAYTINAARLIGRDDEIGSIEPGKKADFVLMDRNLETIPVAEILETRVLWTLFGGKIIHQADTPKP